MKLENVTCKRFTIDACCDNDGVTKQCADYCSPAKSFLHSIVSGQHVWIHAPFRQIESFVKHYLKCKSKVPQTTSACNMVPACYGKWRKLLSNMTLLQKFKRDLTCFVLLEWIATRYSLDQRHGQWRSGMMQPHLSPICSLQ